MSDHKTLNSEVFEIIARWRETEGKIRLYGPSMPQSEQVIEDFHHALVQFFKTVPSFSLVKKEEGVELVTHASGSKGADSHPLGAGGSAAQIEQIFRRFNVQSFTFRKGLTREELGRFFCAINLNPEDPELEDGLAGYFSRHGIKNIKLNKLRFKLLSEGARESGGTKVSDVTEMALKELLNQTQEPLPKDGPVRNKAFASTWENYLSDRLDASDFVSQHPDLINLAQSKPEVLVRALHHMAAKQACIETFLAHLEQKLFDVGFPEEAVANIKKRLLHPQTVTIGEAELARLRQIERESLSDLPERMEKSLHLISTLKGKLADERERGEAIVRQSNQGVMTLDNNGCILELNLIAQKVLGLSSQEARGKAAGDVLKDHHMMSVVSDWNKESDEFTPKQVTIESGHRDVIDTIRESGIVIEDKNGRSIGGVSALQDVVTHRDLEKRKNDILDVLGHDLRAPLNIVKQNIDLISDFVNRPEQIPASEQRKFLDACKRHIDRMHKLINKVLDVRQLETGKMVFKMDDSPLQPIIEDAVHSLDSWAADKQITIDIHTNPLPVLYCDPERIYQVLTNLISNALKFTPDGGHIGVQGTTVDIDDDSFIEVSVTDSGLGIAEEDLERIFNKYEQVSLKSPVGVNGLGLGLSVCKAIIEMHNGHIWAESTIDQGSTLTFQIPILSQEPEA